MRLSLAAFLMLVKQHHVASFAPPVSSFRQRGLLFADLSSNGEQKGGKKFANQLSEDGDHHNHLTEKGRETVDENTIHRDSTAASKVDMGKDSIVNGDGELLLGDSAGDAETLAEGIVQHDERKRTANSPADVNANTATAGVNKSKKVMNETVSVNNPSSAQAPTLSMKVSAEEDGATLDHTDSTRVSGDNGSRGSKGSSASRYAITEVPNKSSKKEAPAFTAFFASVLETRPPVDVESETTSDDRHGSNDESAVTQAKKEEHRADRRDDKSKSEYVASQTKQYLSTEDDDGVVGDVSVRHETANLTEAHDTIANEMPVANVEDMPSELSHMKVGGNHQDNESTVFNLKAGSSGEDSSIAATNVVPEENVNVSSTVSGANFNEEVNGYKQEQLERVNEYNVTSFEELRQNLDEAKLKSAESRERVAAMQQRVDELQKELDFAEDEFQQYLTIKEDESESINARVDELEGLLQAKEDRKRKAEEDLQAAAKESHNRLLKQIEEGKFALRQAKEELDHELEASAQIQSRLDQTKGQVEEEKAVFDSEEAELLAKIKEQTTKVADAETRIKKERDLFEEERMNLGEMLQKQITRVAETNVRLQLEQSMFNMNQVEVQRNIDDITSKLEAVDEAMKGEKENSTKEISELEDSAKEFRQKLVEARDKLEAEQAISRRAKEDLEMRNVFEKVKAKKLATELEIQQKRYRQAIKDLKTVSAKSRSELEQAEALLESSRAQFRGETSTLKDQIADSKRIRKLKAKQMSQRLSDMREELTGLWQGERRKARQEQKELRENYSTRLLNLQEAMPQLEREATEARQVTEDLRLRAGEIMQERAVILDEGRMAEMRYIQAKQERNVAISALENEIDDLKDDISERNERLASYQSSLRVLFGLSIKLTTERLRATRKRFFARFRKPKNGANPSPSYTKLQSMKRLPIALEEDEE